MVATTQSAETFFYVLEDAVRILFVDDDPIMREFAAVHLATDKAELDAAEDGLDALKAVSQADYDLILLDLEMPRMDGFEVLAALRADERTKHLPIVVVTGREDVAAIDRAFQAGATSFLVKPINWRLLSYQIRYVHRANQTELSLYHANQREHLEAKRALDALKRLAQDGADLLRLAMKGDPELRHAAIRYAALLSDVVAPPEPGTGKGFAGAC
jgi:DNA-binding response OmpR family regulator